MPLPPDAILSASMHSAPTPTIYPDEPLQIGDVVLVVEHRQLWWRTITDPAPLLWPPSVSSSGWTFLAKTKPEEKDAAWILRGVESIEHDPGSFAAPETG